MPDMVHDLDQRVRLAAFAFLDALQRSAASDVISRDRLIEGFLFEGQRVPLVSPQQGIFKPRLLPSMPLSVLTAPAVEGRPAPYEDTMGTDGLLEYRYRGTDVNHRDNAGLREAMRQQAPLVYFLGIVPGRYVAAYPVFVVGDRPERLTFSLSVDDRRFAMMGSVAEPGEAVIRRRYVTREIQQRVHQREFRERVLDAYQRHCAVCRLKRDALLDAAHIIGDGEALGDAVVSNGISLCKLHHSAFDANLLGVRPDYVIELREDVLDEVDGPMLVHGLQGWNGMPLRLPRHAALRPDQSRLEERYQRFRAATR